MIAICIIGVTMIVAAIGLLIWKYRKTNTNKELCLVDPEIMSNTSNRARMSVHVENCTGLEGIVKCVNSWDTDVGLLLFLKGCKDVTVRAYMTRESAATVNIGDHVILEGPMEHRPRKWCGDTVDDIIIGDAEPNFIGIRRYAKVVRIIPKEKEAEDGD